MLTGLLHGVIESVMSTRSEMRAVLLAEAALSKINSYSAYL